MSDLNGDPYDFHASACALDKSTLDKPRSLRLPEAFCWLTEAKLVDVLRLDLNFGQAQKIEAQACVIAFLGAPSIDNVVDTAVDPLHYPPCSVVAASRTFGLRSPECCFLQEAQKLLHVRSGNFNKLILSHNTGLVTPAPLVTFPVRVPALSGRMVRRIAIG